MASESKILDRLKSYPPALYEGTNLNWLVLVAVGAVQDAGGDLSLENIVIAAFRLFPKKFSLLTYPEHPDAIRVDKALRRCTAKDRLWLSGKTSQGFAFTQRGRRELDLARQTLQKDHQPIQKSLSQTRRFERLVAEVNASPAYVKYLSGERDKITDSECCHALQGTLDSDRRVLRDNLDKLKQMAADLEQREAVTFMDWLAHRFARLLKEG